MSGPDGDILRNTARVGFGQDLPVTPFASLRTHEIESFEELNEIVLGTQRQVVQIEHGKICQYGSMKHDEAIAVHRSGDRRSR